jgi:hypothetical protein
MSDSLAKEQREARLAVEEAAIEKQLPLKLWLYYFVHPQQVMHLFTITAAANAGAPTQEMVENAFAASLQQNGPGIPSPTHVIEQDLTPLAFEVKRPRVTPAGLVVAH